LALSYAEALATGYPSTGISIGGGKSTRMYRVHVDETRDMLEFINLFLGYTNDHVTDGRLDRIPPLADPEYQWMACSAITSIKPILGRPSAGISVAPPIGGVPDIPRVPTFGVYSDFDVVVEFSPRKFPMVGNDVLPMQHASWWPDKDNDSTDTLQAYDWAPETQRYTTEPMFTNAFEFVTAQRGGMKFITDPAKTYGGEPVNNNFFAGKLKMGLPNQMVRATTVGMPYRYFTSGQSYVTGGTIRDTWLGRINQNPVTIAAYTFPIGSLLYLGYDVEMYTPPVPASDTYFAGPPPVVTQEKLMNLTLLFSHTLRFVSDLTTTPPTNKNAVRQGHNLLPYVVSGKFHYVESDPSKRPLFKSAPLELLWTDPDFIQGVG
jgi:hypothetical protein